MFPLRIRVRFNLTVQRVRVQGASHVEDQEIFPNLSVDPADERCVANVIARSELARLVGKVPAQRPERTLDPVGLASAYVSSSADGDDGAPISDYDLIGSQIDRAGLFALDRSDFNLLCIPPLSREHDVGPSTLLVAARYCQQRRALLIVDPPAAWHTADDALRGLRDWDFASENALMYFPRILAHDKLRGHFESFAPCGAVAGMLARSDEASPMWGPAKPEEAILRPGYRPACLVVEDRRRQLAIRGVNTLQAVRSVMRIGVKARTLAGGTAGAADWQSLAAKRLALFILNSIEHGTRWVIGTQARAQAAETITAEVRSFFMQLYDAGAFPGRRMEEAFFVICDRRNPAPGSDEFQFLIGFAATRPKEFHSFRISHSAAGSKVQAVSINRLNLAEYCPEELLWVEKLARSLSEGSA